MTKATGYSGTSMPEDQLPVVLPEEFEHHDPVTPDEDVARWLRRHYPSGVAVVATDADDGFFGVTVSAFSYISLDPLLLSVALGNESQTGEQIRANGHFGVSMLTNKHQYLADRFAGRAPLVDKRFADVPYLVASTGSPLLADAIAWLDCTLETQLLAGDHSIYVGRAVAVGHGSGDETDPLLYFDSAYSRLA